MNEQTTTGTPNDGAPGAPEPATHRQERHELVSVLVLSIVAVLTAWCGFQASKWGGEMSIAFSQASSARVQAASAAGEARTERSYDLTIYATYIEAVATGQDDLADYVRDRFLPHFAVAFDAWTEDGRPEPSPFAREEYVPPGSERAEELDARADQRFQAALDNNARGDRYSLLTVLFALVLFLTAMAQRARSTVATNTLQGLGIAIAIAGAAILVTFPVKI